MTHARLSSLEILCLRSSICAALLSEEKKLPLLVLKRQKKVFQPCAKYLSLQHEARVVRTEKRMWSWMWEWCSERWGGKTTSINVKGFREGGYQANVHQIHWRRNRENRWINRKHQRIWNINGFFLKTEVDDRKTGSVCVLRRTEDWEARCEALTLKHDFK